MIQQPTGQVTFLFTDIEGSTSLLRRLGDGYSQVLAQHRQIIRAAVAEYRGSVVDCQGDEFLIAFSDPCDALLAAVEAQRSLVAQPWPGGADVKVRMGVHTGDPVVTPEGYTGIDVHRGARIATLGHGGQVLVSDSTARLTQDRLPVGVTTRDLGTYRLKDFPGPERILQLAVPGMRNQFPNLRSQRVRKGNLPISVSSFIGREEEVARVAALVQEIRLVTLTGPGGIGKSRLALAVAERVQSQFADGAWLVELSSLTDPALIAASIASSLAIPEEPGRSMLETLVDSLASRRLLLLLDNSERFTRDCALVCEALLRASPNLRIVGTSREALRIAGEQIYPVPALGYPESITNRDAEDLARYEAVHLFLERAAAVARGFTLTRQNASAVAQICREVDGVPLAIELAAARVAILSPEQIASRLRDRFRLLTGGSRTAPPHQQSLRSTIDWSYDLLPPEERAVLARLSSFFGSFDIEGSEAVCGGTSGEEGPIDVLNCIQALTEKSLVAVLPQVDAGRRLRLLESIRQYAGDRLSERGEVESVGSLHRDYFLQLASNAVPELLGPQQVSWLDRLERESDNCRAALNWSLARGDDVETMQLATALGRYWEKRGFLKEGREWLARVLPRVDFVPLDLQARVAEAAGRLARFQGDYETSQPLLERSLSIYRRLEDRANVASVLLNVGIVVLRKGDFSGARPYQEEALALFQTLGDDRGAGAALLNLGNIARREGNHDLAVSLREQSLERYRAAGDLQGVGTALLNLGVAAADLGDDKEAERRFQEALELGRDLGDWFIISRNLYDIAAIRARKGDPERAASLCYEALSICDEQGDSSGLAACFEVLALIAVGRGDGVRAARLLGVAGLIRDRIHAPLASEVERRLRDSAEAGARALAGNDVYEVEKGVGRSTNPSEMVVYAMEVPIEGAGAAHTIAAIQSGDGT